MVTTRNTQCSNASAIDCTQHAMFKRKRNRLYYQVRMKCRKNYKYIFWFLFDVAITNAFIHSRYSVNTTNATADSMKMFRIKLAQQLIGTYNSRKRPGRPRQPVHTHLTHVPPKGTSRRCKYCTTVVIPPQQRECVWHCPDCPREPSLCLSGTFTLWHSTT